ncbi:hypothetical protein E4U54_007278 [Claviceps lovelessii]|nr:hypothetical protein E4U54_007278 [Claviceps lovelessii]
MKSSPRPHAKLKTPLVEPLFPRVRSKLPLYRLGKVPKQVIRVDPRKRVLQEAHPLLAEQEIVECFARGTTGISSLVGSWFPRGLICLQPLRQFGRGAVGGGGGGGEGQGENDGVFNGLRGALAWWFL